MRHIALLSFALSFASLPSIAAQPSVDSLDRMAKDQAALNAKIDKYDRALTALQSHLDNKDKEQQSQAVKPQSSTPKATSTPVPLSDVTFTLSPEPKKEAVAAPKDEAHKPSEIPAKTPPKKELTPSPSDIPSTPSLWSKFGWLFWFAVGLLSVFVVGVLMKRRKIKEPPLFQAASSRYLPLQNESHPLYRFFVKQAHEFMKQGLALRAKNQAKTFDNSTVFSLKDRPYGRWILGQASFEDEVKVAESVTQQIMKTFPFDKQTALNGSLLRDATLAVLRGQSNY